MFNSTDISCRCRPFAGHPIAMHMVRVEGADVLVYDEIAGHFTRCHTLSPYYTSKILRWYASERRAERNQIARARAAEQDWASFDRWFWGQEQHTAKATADQCAQAADAVVRDAAELRAM